LLRGKAWPSGYSRWDNRFNQLSIHLTAHHETEEELIFKRLQKLPQAKEVIEEPRRRSRRPGQGGSIPIFRMRVATGRVYARAHSSYLSKAASQSEATSGDR